MLKVVHHGLVRLCNNLIADSLATFDSFVCIVKCNCGFFVVFVYGMDGKKRVKERVEKW